MTFCNKGVVQADPPPQVVVKYHIFTFFLDASPMLPKYLFLNYQHTFNKTSLLNKCCLPCVGEGPLRLVLEKSLVTCPGFVSMSMAWRRSIFIVIVLVLMIVLVSVLVFVFKLPVLVLEVVAVVVVLVWSVM